MQPAWLPPKPPTAELAELQSLHTELEAAAKPGTSNADQFFADQRALSHALLEIANNRWRDQMVADLRKVMKLNRHNSLLKTGRMHESLAEHRAIMAALLARDAGKTVQRMRSTLLTGWKRRLRRDRPTGRSDSRPGRTAGPGNTHAAQRRQHRVLPYAGQSHQPCKYR
jgi:DNA-binding GntR family transcriptional regulator